jgi:hypothetical protein
MQRSVASSKHFQRLVFLKLNAAQSRCNSAVVISSCNESVLLPVVVSAVVPQPPQCLINPICRVNMAAVTSFQTFQPRPLKRNLSLQVRFALSLVSDYVSSWRAAPALRSSWANVERYCVFVGYPSSGHSLFGALLDAHPEIFLSHELDALKYVSNRFSREQLYALILQRGRAFIESGGVWNNYDYLVQGQWQGRFSTLRVIGDKKGGLSALQIRENPELIAHLRALVGVPVAVIHMTRNPYDVMATRYKRHREGMEMGWYVDRFFEHCEGVRIARDLVGADNFYDVRHEDVVANTAGELTRACNFLGVEAPADYLEACAAKVFESPRRTRATAPWTPELLARAESQISQYSFLQGYTFEG